MSPTAIPTLTKPRRATRSRGEQTFQISVVRCLNILLTPATRFFHVPNGGFRTRAEAGILKVMGVRPGMMDLIFLHRHDTPSGTLCCAYGIELKTDKGALSADQQSVHADLAAIGMPIKVARNLDEVLETLELWGIPLRVKAKVAGGAS